MTRDDTRWHDTRRDQPNKTVLHRFYTLHYNFLHSCVHSPSNLWPTCTRTKYRAQWNNVANVDLPRILHGVADAADRPFNRNNLPESVSDHSWHCIWGPQNCLGKVLDQAIRVKTSFNAPAIGKSTNALILKVCLQRGRYRIRFNHSGSWGTS